MTYQPTKKGQVFTDDQKAIPDKSMILDICKLCLQNYIYKKNSEKKIRQRKWQVKDEISDAFYSPVPTLMAVAKKY